MDIIENFCGHDYGRGGLCRCDRDIGGGGDRTEGDRVAVAAQGKVKGPHFISGNLCISAPFHAMVVEILAVSHSGHVRLRDNMFFYKQNTYVVVLAGGAESRHPSIRRSSYGIQKNRHRHLPLGRDPSLLLSHQHLWYCGECWDRKTSKSRLDEAALHSTKRGVRG